MAILSLAAIQQILFLLLLLICLPIAHSAPLRSLGVVGTPTAKFRFDQHKFNEMIRGLQNMRSLIALNQTAMMNTYLHGTQAFEFQPSDLTLFPDDYCFVCNTIAKDDPILSFEQKVIEVDIDNIRLVHSYVDSTHGFEWPLMKETGRPWIFIQFLQSMREHGHRVGIPRERLMKAYWMVQDSYRCWPRDSEATTCKPFTPSATSSTPKKTGEPTKSNTMITTSFYSTMPIMSRLNFRDYAEIINSRNMELKSKIWDKNMDLREHPISGIDASILKYGRVTTDPTYATLNSLSLMPTKVLDTSMSSGSPLTTSEALAGSRPLLSTATVTTTIATTTTTMTATVIPAAPIFAPDDVDAWNRVNSALTAIMQSGGSSTGR